MTMEQLPEQPPPPAADGRTVRVVHVSVQPKSWIGRLVLGIVGVAAMVVAVFLSVIAFAVVAGLVAVALIYLLWVTRPARRAMRDQVIEGEVKGRDIQ
jgi:hypothetical protein